MRVRNQPVRRRAAFVSVSVIAMTMVSAASTAVGQRIAMEDVQVPASPLGFSQDLPRDLRPPSEPASATVATPEAGEKTGGSQAVSATVAPAPVVAATPAFSLLTEMRDRLARDRQNAIPKEDRDDVAKFYESRQGAPLWVDATGLTARALQARIEFDKAADFALDAKAFETDEPKSRSAIDLADAEYDFMAAALRYARHARGGRVEPTRLSKGIDRKAQLLPIGEVLSALANSQDIGATLRGFHPQHPQFEKLRQVLLRHRAGETVVDVPPTPEPRPGKKAAKAPPVPSRASIERKLVTNMEMWRWMPALGDYYIKSNVPEFQFSVVRGGQTIHSERIIVGKPATMTPMFSDEMQHLVFKPFWNVPESIKWKELQPQLMQSGAALSRAGLKAQINGRDVNPATVEWDLMDMRQVHIFQPPGPGNALGQVKFMFPNKHDVYMHDTPTKPLFNNSVRAYSHGCMRVRDPLKFAEVILGNDKGWSRAQINQLANSGPDNNEIKLDRKIPVHVTYFTAWVDDDGKLKTFNDLYGHENRIQLGIEGKTHLIPQPSEEKFSPPSRQDRERMAQIRRQREQAQDPIGTIFKSLFNF